MSKTASKKAAAAPEKAAAAEKNQAPDLDKIRVEIEAELRPVLEAEIKATVLREEKSKRDAIVKAEVEAAVDQALEEIHRKQAAAAAQFQADLEKADAALAKDFPRYFSVAQHLDPDQRSAIHYLETVAGFEVFVQSKLGEVTEKNGTRRRTFCRRGRYDLILARKSVQAPVENPAPAQPDPDDAPAPAAAQGNLFDANQAKIDRFFDMD